MSQNRVEFVRWWHREVSCVVISFDILRLSLVPCLRPRWSRLYVALSFSFYNFYEYTWLCFYEQYDDDDDNHKIWTFELPNTWSKNILLKYEHNQSHPLCSVQLTNGSPNSLYPVNSLELRRSYQWETEDRHHYHHFHYFRLLLAVDMRNLIYMSRQYRPTYNEKYTEHKT